MASTGEPWRLGRRPSLDGLRGIAVLLVVASHLVEGGAVHALGPAGVTVFFTLSGFLITALLLEERKRFGRTDLRAFYRRRVLRLAPALVALVAVTTLVGIVVGGEFMSWTLVLGAVTYTSNWIEVAGVGTGSGLAHTWSLAVEEQFYLVWPVVLIVLSRFHRRWMIGCLAAGIIASACSRLALADEGWQRVYYGFDVHADGLLIGCLLAVVLHGRRTGRSRSLIAAAALGCVVPAVTAGFAFTLLLLPLVVSLATAVAIYAAAQVGEVRWLSWGPLALVGRRSYGLYLWHWPIFVLAGRVFHDPGPVVLLVTAVPLSWAMTLLSWRFVESPFLRFKRPSAVLETHRFTVAHDGQHAEQTLIRRRHPDERGAASARGRVRPAGNRDLAALGQQAAG